MFDPEEEALKKILGDVDGMEGQELSAPQGATITISVVPSAGGASGAGDGISALPADPSGAMQEMGGELPGDTMAEGGVVGSHPIEKPPEAGLGLPPADPSGAEAVLPQLRRKKKTLAKPS